MTVVVGTARVVLHIPASQSLKDKRQVVRSLVALAQRQFQISVAEVDDLDRWQLATLGLACVANDPRHADEVISRALGFISTRRIDVDVVEVQTELLHVY
ncbi:MAG TPA: DUF503 domain-containing protein [Chloroflexota bacterium]|nr:DUF503 domain-containing protein [Chloroflexota bacterium]